MLQVNGKAYRTLGEKIYVNGRQVQEVYVNGQKVYPEYQFSHHYGGTKTGETKNPGTGPSVSYQREWEWFIDGQKYIPRYERPNSSYPTTSKPTSEGWYSYLSWRSSYSWYDAEASNHPHPFLTANENITLQLSLGDYSWISEYLTSGSQALLASLEAGITLSGSRTWQYVYRGDNFLLGSSESDLALYVQNGAMDSSSSGNYGITVYYTVIRALLYIDPSKCGPGKQVTKASAGAGLYVSISDLGFNITANGFTSNPSMSMHRGTNISETSYFEPVQS